MEHAWSDSCGNWTQVMRIFPSLAGTACLIPLNLSKWDAVGKWDPGRGMAAPAWLCKTGSQRAMVVPSLHALAFRSWHWAMPDWPAVLLNGFFSVWHWLLQLCTCVPAWVSRSDLFLLSFAQSLPSSSLTHPDEDLWGLNLRGGMSTAELLLQQREVPRGDQITIYKHLQGGNGELRGRSNLGWMKETLLK